MGAYCTTAAKGAVGEKLRGEMEEDLLRSARAPAFTDKKNDCH